DAERVHVGGASPIASLVHAARAVAGGRSQNVLVTVGWNGYTAMRPKPGARRRRLEISGLTRTFRDFYRPFGAVLPAQIYAWIATRYQKEFAVPPEAPGTVAVACRRHAQKNARALMRGKPLTMDD